MAWHRLSEKGDQKASRRRRAMANASRRLRNMGYSQEEIFKLNYVIREALNDSLL